MTNLDSIFDEMKDSYSQRLILARISKNPLQEDWKFLLELYKGYKNCWLIPKLKMKLSFGVSLLFWLIVHFKIIVL